MTILLRFVVIIIIPIVMNVIATDKQELPQTLLIPSYLKYKIKKKRTFE